MITDNAFTYKKKGNILHENQSINQSWELTFKLSLKLASNLKIRISHSGVRQDLVLAVYA